MKSARKQRGMDSILDNPFESRGAAGCDFNFSCRLFPTLGHLCVVVCPGSLFGPVSYRRTAVQVYGQLSRQHQLLSVTHELCGRLSWRGFCSSVGADCW